MSYSNKYKKIYIPYPTVHRALQAHLFPDFKKDNSQLGF